MAGARLRDCLFIYLFLRLCVCSHAETATSTVHSSIVRNINKEFHCRQKKKSENKKRSWNVNRQHFFVNKMIFRPSNPIPHPHFPWCQNPIFNFMTQFQVLKCSEILLSALSSCVRVRVLYKIVLLSVVSKSRDGVCIFEFAVPNIKISSHFWRAHHIFCVDKVLSKIFRII